MEKENSSNGVIEIHSFLEGGGSEYLGDWIVEIDWGGKNPFEIGVEPKSITLLKLCYDGRTR